MRPLEEIYTNRFFKWRDKKLSWRVPIIVSAIVEELNPVSVVDAGAAIGNIVREFNVRGVDALGIEGSKRAVPHLVCERGHMLFEDFRKPITLNAEYDLCTCFEVAEHIEEEYADQFIENLCSFSKRILVSICNEGAGTHHVNLKPMHYWDGKFENAGYRQQEEVSDNIKKHLAPFEKKPWMKMIIDRLHFYEEKL
jgi:hypothetical protein